MKFKQLNEKATSVAQQRLMALALQHKRGELPADKVSPAVKDLAKDMSEKDLEDFAKTKHKGLPQKKEDNEISNRSADLKPQMYNDPVTGKKKVKMVPAKSNIVKTNDPVKEAKDPGEYDNEGEMAKNQLKSILRDAGHMVKMFDDEENLPEWVQNKITKAQDYLQSAHSYMMGQDDDDNDDDEVKESVNEVGLGGTAGTAVQLGTAAAIGGAAYGVKKAVDRFRPTKVAKARQDREDKRQARQAAQDQIKKLRQKEREKRTAAVTNTARKAGQAFGKLRKRVGGKPARRPAG